MGKAEEVKDYTAYFISRSKLEKDYEYKTSECIKRRISFINIEKFIAEYLLEKIRISDPYRLPSRQTCLFVCDKEMVKYWHDYIEKRIKRKPFIYKLNLTGSLFWTYADYFTMSMYWNPKDKPIEREGLFEGEYVVIEECDINDFT